MKEKKERILFLYFKTFADLALMTDIYYSLCAMGMTTIPALVALSQWIVDFYNAYNIRQYTKKNGELTTSGYCLQIKLILITILCQFSD